MSSRLSPRLIAQFSTAAATGLALMGCHNERAAAEQDETHAAGVEVAEPATQKGDKACCMGLNECKGQGGCAVPESHACAGKNECKGKGGCNMHCPK